VIEIVFTYIKKIKGGEIMKRKSLLMLGLSMILALGLAGAAWATPSITLGTVTLSGSDFNGIKAVCGTTSNITVSVNVTSASFDPSDTCVAVSEGGKRRATGGGEVTVFANGVQLSNGGAGSTYSGAIAVGPEGLNTVNVTATATDNYDLNNTCNPGGNKSSEDATTAVDYVTDKEPPTLEVKAYSPGPDPPTTIIPTINAGEAIALNVGIKNGSSGAPYSASLSTSYPDSPSNLGPFTVNDSFNNPTHDKDDGIDKQEHVKDLALQTLSTTPGGIYTMKVELNTKDLCGNNFPTITKYPAEANNNPSGTFEVLNPVQLGIITHVVSEFPNGEYGIDECFTSVASKKKITNNPGSVHIAAVVTSTAPTGITNPVIALTLPEGFTFLLTGQSPAAHVFVGVPAGGFDFHYPDPLVEVTASAVISGQATQIMTVDLSNVDVGLGAGVIPQEDTIYIRAHAIYTGPGAALTDSEYVFTTAVTADEGVATDDETVIGNPSTTGVCVNGILE
jgi:hypothetical protein